MKAAISSSTTRNSATTNTAPANVADDDDDDDDERYRLNNGRIYKYTYQYQRPVARDKIMTLQIPIKLAVYHSSSICVQRPQSSPRQLGSGVFFGEKYP